MGLFDFLKGNTDKKESSSSSKAPYYGDLSKTTLLRELFLVPQEKRDEKWKNTFLENIADASFVCAAPQVIQGPDGFPYFIVNLPEPNVEFQCYVIKHMITDFLLERGFGVVVQLNKGEPEWVFSYGDVLNYHLNKQFYSPIKEMELSSKETIQKEEQILVGQPSELLLPSKTRLVIKGFLKTLAINDAKVFLMSRHKPEGMLQDLVFNLTPDRFASLQQFESVMRCISWFLPRHYTMVGMEEAGYEKEFKPL